MFNSRNSVWLIPLLLLLSAPLWWYPLNAFLTPRYDDIQRDDLADVTRSFVMKKAVLDQYVEGRRQWLVKADKVSSAAMEDDYRLEKVKGVLYDSGGKVEAEFRGNQGSYEKEKEIFVLMDQAVVRLTKGGWVLKGESLSYDVKKRQVNSATPVSVAGRDVKVKGSGMRYDMKSGRLQVEGRVGCDIS